MAAKNKKSPAVGIIMGSDSDWPTMKAAAEVLKDFSISYEAVVVSAHRTPNDMASYAENAADRGLKVIIAGAGGAAHLPGMTASHTTLPVIGVPIISTKLNGLDSLLSIVQMPKGVPVATMAIENSTNAGLLAVRILATTDNGLAKKIKAHQDKMAKESRLKNKKIKK